MGERQRIPTIARDVLYPLLERDHAEYVEARTRLDETKANLDQSRTQLLDSLCRLYREVTEGRDLRVDLNAESRKNPPPDRPI